MIKRQYKSTYIQKRYGLGGIFRGIAKMFRPIARNLSNTIRRPEVQRVLKTIGKETLDTGSELLLDTIKGNDIEMKLDKRINLAKQRIADSIEDGISMSKRARDSRKYHRLIDENNDVRSSNKYSKKPTRINIKKYDQLKTVNPYTTTSSFNKNVRNVTKKERPTFSPFKKVYTKKRYRTVFD